MEVRRAHVAQKALLETLLEKYLYELSFFEGERFGEDGTFGYPYLAAYWQEEGRHPYLLYADGRLSGLCLVNRIPAADAPLDHAVAEFFVAPPSRRLADRLPREERPGRGLLAPGRADPRGRAGPGAAGPCALRRRLPAPRALLFHDLNLQNVAPLPFCGGARRFVFLCCQSFSAILGQRRDSHDSRI